MKTHTRMIIASIAVLAMLLSTVGGVTYSWFADERSVDVETGTAALDVGYYMYHGTQVMNALNLSKGAQTVEFTLRICNDSPIDVAITASLEVQRYYAVKTVTNTDGTSTESLYKELTKNSDGSYSENTTTAYISGNAAKWSELSVKYGDGTAIQFKNGQSPYDPTDYTDDDTTYKVRHTTYEAKSDQITVNAGSTQEVKVTMTSTDGFVPYSDLFHFVLRAAQGDIVGQVSQYTMGTVDGSKTKTVQSSDFGDAGVLEFTDGTSKVRIGKQAFSGQSQITVSWTDTADSTDENLITRTTSVTGVSDAGWIQYEMVCDGPVWKVVSGEGSSDTVPVTVSCSEGKTTVSFSDSAVVAKHTVVYQKQETA